MATNGYRNPDPLTNRYGRPSKVALELEAMAKRHAEESAMIRTKLDNVQECLQRLNTVLAKIEANEQR